LLRDATSPEGGRFICTDRKLQKSSPLRGKTSPAPGEDVTAGDKRGNLARRQA
jgi:hypothetical protein